MDNARSVWIILLALLFVALLWAWATGRAKSVLSALRGVTPAPAPAAAPGAAPTANGTGVSLPPSYVTPPVAFTLPTIPAFSVGGAAFNIPQLVTAPPVAAVNSGVLPQYTTTVAVPSNYGGLTLSAALSRIFGGGSPAGTIAGLQLARPGSGAAPPTATVDPATVSVTANDLSIGDY